MFFYEVSVTSIAKPVQDITREGDGPTSLADRQTDGGELERPMPRDVGIRMGTGRVSAGPGRRGCGSRVSSAPERKGA